MSCEKHKRHIEKYNGTLEELSNDLGDLHYESLQELLNLLSHKLLKDSIKDRNANRIKLSDSLIDASNSIKECANNIGQSWLISKPFMTD